MKYLLTLLILKTALTKAANDPNKVSLKQSELRGNVPIHFLQGK